MSNFTGLGNVNWQEIESVGFSPLPAGIYGAKITKAELKDSKNGKGKNIVLEISLVGAKGIKGRKVFDYLAVQHENATAVNIALAKLKGLIKLIGKNPEDVQDTSELVGEMIAVKLKVDKGNETYGPSNKVVAFEAFNEELLEKELVDSDEIPF